MLRVFSQVRFKKLYPGAKPPIYQTESAVGADLSSIEHVRICPGEFKLVKTGIAVELPLGIEMQIRPRSGLAYKHGVTVLNAPGTIDSDYRGEVGVILINHGSDDFVVCIGDRIAQAVLNEVVLTNYKEVDELSDTLRGEDGFGSTGKA
jgi:dUTP pyrophosphatase